jgi:hypothetical protein
VAGRVKGGQVTPGSAGWPYGHPFTIGRLTNEGMNFLIDDLRLMAANRLKSGKHATIPGQHEKSRNPRWSGARLFEFTIGRVTNKGLMFLIYDLRVIAPNRQS